MKSFQETSRPAGPLSKYHFFSARMHVPNPNPKVRANEGNNELINVRWFKLITTSVQLDVIYAINTDRIYKNMRW